jgi:hypothetical protein
MLLIVFIQLMLLTVPTINVTDSIYTINVTDSTYTINVTDSTYN